MPSDARRPDVRLSVPTGIDAREWAVSLMAHAKRYGFEIDEETMIGWFANAIMAGLDEGVRRARAESHVAALEAENMKMREALMYVDDVFTRGNMEPNDWMGDDEHEAWGLARAALADAPEEKP